MKKIIISLLVIANIVLANSDGGFDNFSTLSKSEQDKIIQKDFKILDELMGQLAGIISHIDDTRKRIADLKGKNREKLCNKALTLSGDIAELERQLSLIHNKKSNEYKNVHQEYLNTKNFYNSILCEEKK